MGGRLLYGLYGAAFGAGIALSIYWYLDDSNWVVVGAAAGVGCVIGLLGGKSAIRVLRGLFDAAT